MGLDHALAAKRSLPPLDAKRERGACGRRSAASRLRKGRLDRRATGSQRPVESRRRTLGDLVGLARSTAAISELLAATGRTATR